MIPSESPLVASDFVDARYLAGSIDYVGDITAYADETQGTVWRDRYLELLEGNSYEWCCSTLTERRTFITRVSVQAASTHR